MKLKSVHFWAFFVFSETEKNDFAQWIIGSQNDIPRSRKNGFHHILGTASRNWNLRFQSWFIILGTKNIWKIREISRNFRKFWEFFKIRSKIFERKFIFKLLSYCWKQEKSLKFFYFLKIKNFLLPTIGKNFRMKNL